MIQKVDTKDNIAILFTKALSQKGLRTTSARWACDAKLIGFECKWEIEREEWPKSQS